MEVGVVLPGGAPERPSRYRSTSKLGVGIRIIS